MIMPEDFQWKNGTAVTYSYDPRGNILSESGPDRGASYAYDGEKLISVNISGDNQQSCAFAHDALGRMIHNGMTGQQIAYNDLDLVRNIESNGTTLVNYSYLADGTKFSALDDEGRGLEYHGSLTFRKNGASRQVESREFSCGRIYLMLGTPTPFVPFYHVKDYLGSVRAVVDGRSGEVVEANDYYAFGSRWETSSSSGTISNRYRFNGKEDQEGEFGVPTLDYGARHYTPSSARWLSMDPLAEKYYGVSPYAFCNNNPVNFVDPDGELPFLANFVGGFVSAGVEYGSQVIGNIFSDGFSVESFTNVDVFDIGVAFGEGFITSGTNVARKVITKAAVELTGEIARNAVDVKIGYGTDHTPIVNSFGDVIVDTAIGVASEAIHIDVNISPFKGVSGTKAVRAAREAADKSLSPQVADGVRRQNAMLNAEKAAANQAISEGVGSVLGSVASKVIDEIQDKYRD